METRHEACSAEGQPRNILTTIRTDSQAAAPRCHAAVIALSTAVVHFFAISHPNSARVAVSRHSRRFARRADARSGRVNEEPTGRKRLLRTGAGVTRLRVHQFKTKASIAACN